MEPFSEPPGKRACATCNLPLGQRIGEPSPPFACSVSRVEEGVHEHARALGKMEKMHVVSLNMLMWLTRAVSDVSQSIEAVPSATKEGLRRLLKESAPCVPELADEDIYTLRCGGGVLGQRDVKKER